MALNLILLFCLFLLLSAFFSASETALIASNPNTIDLLAEKGSRRARLIKRQLDRLDRLLATILIGNNLVNIAAATVATLFFLSIIRDRQKAALAATLVTTVLILFFAEINPKTLAAYHPLKTSFLVIQPLRLFAFLFSPFVSAFTVLSGRILRRAPESAGTKSQVLNEEEIRLLLSRGVKGMSPLRRRMIGGVLNIGGRPVKEILIPRPELRAIEIGASFDEIMDTVLATEYSRLPVYRGRMDRIEGLIHTKDIIPYLVEKKEFDIRKILRRPFFIPESVSIEKALLQMQENAVHLAFVVDEFGTLEGIVTLEDIIEEIVGEIQDESDEKAEEWLKPEAEKTFLVKGNASIKELCERLPLSLPQTAGFTTLAGFLLYQFGKIPRENDALEFQGHRFMVEKMNKRHISLVRIILNPERSEDRS